MSATRIRRRAGAERRTTASPFGDREKRLEWASRIAALGRLDDAVAALIDWREKESHNHLTDKDALWIGARLDSNFGAFHGQDWQWSAPTALFG